MILWRPKNRGEWWFAFVGALVVLAPALSFGGIAIAQHLQAEDLSFLGPVVAAQPAIYLVLVSRLRLLWKALLVPVLAVGLAFIYVPRSSCGDVDENPTTQFTGHTMVKGCNG